MRSVHSFDFFFLSGDSNQIVTLVQSEGDGDAGELSYVLIVEESGNDDKDTTVYDFNEAGVSQW